MTIGTSTATALFGFYKFLRNQLLNIEGYV
jgi:hypothetical protein